MIDNLESELGDIWKQVVGSASWLWYNEDLYIRRYDNAEKELVFRKINDEYVGRLFRENIIGDSAKERTIWKHKATKSIIRYPPYHASAPILLQR